MKRMVTFIMAFMLCFTTLTPGFAAGTSIPANATEKLTVVETYLYGTEQSGSLVNRVDKLEADVMGKTDGGAVLTRVDGVYNQVKGVPPDGSLSFNTKLNAIESQFADHMSMEPAKTRIEALEQTLNGKSNATESLLTRLNSLFDIAFKKGSVTPSAVVVPKDALIKVKFLEDINSKTDQAGADISFVVADNVSVGETVVIPKGAKGYGTIKKIVQPRIFGRDARIDLEFSHIIAVDGTEIPVYVGDLAKQEAATMAGAAGASIGGMIIFGPVGVVGGAFVKGQSVTIPAGSFTMVQVKEDTTVNGYIQTGTTTLSVQAEVPVPEKVDDEK